MKNKIFVVGFGAIGKALAVSLRLEGRIVAVLRGSVDDEPSRIEQIEVALNDGTTLAAEIEVSTLSRFERLDGIVVLTSKSYGNESLSRALKDKTSDSPIVILQNGLGVERAFIEKYFPEIYRCVLFATSQSVSENKVSFKPVAVSPIGAIKGGDANLNMVVERLNTRNFQFRAEADIQPVIWQKAIINSVFNSVCPLLEVDNGVFHREEKALAIARRVIEECVTVAQAAGIFLETETVIEKLLIISKASDGQLISTLQDIRNKRKTEIETLNFEIVSLAKDLNHEDAVRETKLLGELTLLKSESSRLKI